LLLESSVTIITHVRKIREGAFFKYLKADLYLLLLLN
jgi:hypothetical protein